MDHPPFTSSNQESGLSNPLSKPGLERGNEEIFASLTSSNQTLPSPSLLARPTLIVFVSLEVKIEFSLRCQEELALLTPYSLLITLPYLFRHVRVRSAFSPIFMSDFRYAFNL